MITLTRKCSSCGGTIDLIDDKCLPIGIKGDTLIFCKECLYGNQYFKDMAMSYVKEHTDEFFKEGKK